MKKFLAWLQRNIFVRNLILAVCSIIVFIFLVNIGLRVFTRHNSYHQVPDFSGMTMEEAVKAARSGSLKLEVNDSRYVPEYETGAILAQTPEPGTNVKSGRRILLTINTGKRKMVRIPYVTGVSLRQAKNDLDRVGLELDKLVYKNDIATNYVLETRYKDKVVSPGSRLEAEEGSGITLIVGMKAGEATTIIPKVIGFPLKEAKNRLWEVGLNLGNVSFDENVTLLERNDTRVWRQSPEQGSRVTLGTTVTLYLTLDDDKVGKGSSASDKEAQKIISIRQAQEAVREHNETEAQETLETSENE